MIQGVLFVTTALLLSILSIFLSIILYFCNLNKYLSYILIIRIY